MGNLLANYENIIFSPEKNEKNMILNTEIAKHSLKDNLKMFNLIYVTYSFTKNYKFFNEKNIFLKKIEIEKTSKVLILSKMILRYIPLVQIPINLNNNSKNNNSNPNTKNLNISPQKYPERKLL